MEALYVAPIVTQDKFPAFLLYYLFHPLPFSLDLRAFKRPHYITYVIADLFKGLLELNVAVYRYVFPVKKALLLQVIVQFVVQFFYERIEFFQ